MRNRIYKLVTGHRGKIKGVEDQIKKAVYAHPCIICGETMTRKLYENGRFETWSRFFKRKTCSRECKTEALKGKGNPNYKGIMHIQCKYCGKDGLSYVASLKGEKMTEMCKDCANKHHSDWSKKEEIKIYKCTKCGKDVINRYKNGHKRYLRNGKMFCSTHCSNSFRDLKREKVVCVVCKKEITLLPSRAKIRKTCSLKCNGILASQKRWG